MTEELCASPGWYTEGVALQKRLTEQARIAYQLNDGDIPTIQITFDEWYALKLFIESEERSYCYIGDDVFNKYIHKCNDRRSIYYSTPVGQVKLVW